MTQPSRAFVDLLPPRGGMSFAEAEKAVKVKFEKGRGWHIDVWVKWPGRHRARRERIAWAPSIGKFESKRDAERVANRIRALAEDRPLHEVLIEYVRRDVPENHVIHRWRVDLIAEMRRRHEAGELGVDRLKIYEAYPRRGYLDFFKGISVHHVDELKLQRWVQWLRTEERFDLQPTTIREIVRNFGLFLRLERSLGAILRAPDLPVVRVPRKPKRVPSKADLARILEAIPEERRGLWLARALAGLRPREAREANVGDYRNGTLHLRPETVKTKEPRSLKLDIVAPDVDAWIKKWRDQALPWEPLFPQPTAKKAEKRWTTSTEWLCWRAACIAAAVEYIRPNWGGRHAFATHEAKGGSDLLALQRWMGHAKFATTEQYLGEWDEIELARALRPAKSRAAQSPPSPSTGRDK